jgi:hypothetical protein
MSLDQIFMVPGFSAAYGGEPAPEFNSPADLSPLAWFRLSTGSYQSDGVTPAVSGDTMQFLRAEGDATKYYEQVTAGNRPVLATVGGKLCFSGYTSAAARYLRMAGVSTLITQLPKFSISIWINGPAPPSSTHNNRPIFGESNVSGSSPNAGRVFFQSGPTSSSAMLFRETNDINTNTSSKTLNGAWLDSNWHHLVWTDDNGVVVYYRDGVPYSEFSYTRRTVTVINQGIGVSPTTSPGSLNSQFNGNIGNNIVLDNKIWTQADVDNLYAFG